MQIEFECEGGYGGLFATRPLSYRVRLEDLPKNVHDKLQQLVRSSGLLDLEPVDIGKQPSRARDAFNYKLSIRDQHATKAFTFDDVSAPEAVRPLLNYLRELAIEARR